MSHSIAVRPIPAAARALPWRRRLIPWLFVAPCLLVILVVSVFPTLHAFYLNLHKWELMLKDKPFIGFGNYVQLFQDERFLHAAWVTLLLVVVGVLLELILGFALAEMVMGEMKGKRLYVALMLLPVMIMPVVVGFTWRLLWDAQYGPINQMIGWILGRPFTYVWLGQTSTALFAIIVTDIWQWTPFMFLIFFAGLSTLDQELFEAAAIDGAGAWNRFWRITIPLMRPILIVAVLIRGLDALKAFDLIYTLTGGSPGSSTETVSYYIYQTGFQFFRLGYGAAASFLLLLVLSLLLTYLIKLLRPSAKESEAARLRV